MSRRRFVLLLLPAVWFVGLLCIPVIGYLAGERQPLLENRAKEPFPPLNRSSIRSPEVFSRLDRALLDRLPLRDDALRARASLGLGVFGVSPSPEVIAGTGGWLYLWRDFRPCLPGGSDGVPGEAAEIIARTTGASGRRVGVLLAGSKTARHPEHLRTERERAQARCVAEREEAVQARLRATPGGLDISPGLEREVAAGRDVFLRQDSHWAGNAQLLFVRSMLDAARPGLSADVGLRQLPTPRKAEMDLTKMVGFPENQDTTPPIATRPLPYPQARPNETVLIGDSQMRLAMTDELSSRPSISAAALPGPFYCERSKFNIGVCNPQLAASRTVLFEWVARDMQDMLTACTHFPPTLLPDLRRRLRALPASLMATADGKRVRRLRLGDTPPVVRFAPSDGDVSRSLRLMVVEVERLDTPGPGGAQQVTLVPRPTDGRPDISCATASAAAGGAIIVPVPAGRDAAKMAFELTAPPGTVLGNPQAFTLDDATVNRGMRDALRR